MIDDLVLLDIVWTSIGNYHAQAKHLLHGMCMNSSAGTDAQSIIAPFESTPLYVKIHNKNPGTSIQKQSGSYTQKKIFACEYRQLQKRFTLICRYTPGCTYSDANIFTHKPRSKAITAAHENTKIATLCSFYKARNSHIIELVLPNRTTIEFPPISVHAWISQHSKSFSRLWDMSNEDNNVNDIKLIVQNGNKMGKSQHCP